MTVNALSKTITIITPISFPLERQTVIFIQVLEAVALISQSPLGPCVPGRSYLTWIFICSYYRTIFLTENNLTHIDPCNTRCLGLSILPYLFLSLQLHQRLTECLLIFGLPFIGMEGWYKCVPFTFWPWLPDCACHNHHYCHTSQLSSSFPPAPISCWCPTPMYGIVHFDQGPGTFCGQAVSAFCIPQKWDIKIIVFLWVRKWMQCQDLSFIVFNHQSVYPFCSEIIHGTYMINIC